MKLTSMNWSCRTAFALKGGAWCLGRMVKPAALRARAAVQTATARMRCVDIAEGGPVNQSIVELCALSVLFQKIVNNHFFSSSGFRIDSGLDRDPAAQFVVYFILYSIIIFIKIVAPDIFLML